MPADLAEIVKTILRKHRIDFEFEAVAGNRFIFHWHDVMYDPGLSAQNVMLDYTLDSQDRDIFLGLIRLPAEYRGRGIGAEIVEAMKHYATESGYTIILESADENTDFWLKEHFATFLHEDYGFWIMGYGGENRQKWLNDWQHIKSGLYPAAHKRERNVP
ncbi:GNAT family N-acetyltransferase [Paenibacillus cymbidii]|uniref:GNAT family N-acetyltransferase n=1 Tax=Paenibacillus cymbidii TaxID=1639034 RepID=UPI0010819443|nr:GNAT family N-acetyltransferase [Paenibacillus cymbidii]